MSDQNRNALNSAAKAFLLVFAVGCSLLALAIGYRTIRFGWTDAYELVVENLKNWLGALILTATVCAAGDILGSIIDRLWKPGK